MSVIDIVNKYLKKKSENILLDIVQDVTIQSETNEIIKYILKNNIIVNKKLINDALHYSVYNGLNIIVKTLLKYGKADPNYSEQNGFRMIDITSDHYYMLTVKELYKYGGRGIIWCTDKKSCEDFINSYIDKQREDNIVDRKYLSMPSFNKNKINNFEKKKLNTEISQNILKNIVIE